MEAGIVTSMNKKIIRLIKSPWRFFRRLSFKKKLLFLFLLLVVGFLVRSQFAKAKPPEYELATATRSSIVEHVSETGNVTAAGATPVYSTTTGIVEEVYVANNTLVAKGDPLFKVTSTATKQERDSALSNYLAAKTTLETAQASQLSLQAQMFSAWDSFKELAESDEYENGEGVPRYEERGVAEFHVSEKQWLSAEAAYKKQKQAISQAQAQVSATWQAYQSTVDSSVTAVIGGVINNLGITKGSLVTVPTVTSIGSVPPALVLVTPDVTTTIKLDIGETDAIKVATGQPTTITFDALPHQTFLGYIDRVDTIATPSNGVVTYSVYVVINLPSDSIRAGMTADVDIEVASKENVLTVPSSAVKPYEGGRAVRVVGAEGEIEYIQVEVGARGDGVTEIVSGINEGTQVIVALKNEQVKRQGPSFF